MNTQQQTSSRRSERRRAFAWIACFVILFAGLAMPMTPTMPRSDGERALWSNLCGGNGARIGIRLDGWDPRQDSHTTLQHDACCINGLSILAIPVDPAATHFALIQRTAFPINIVRIAPWPRVNWPTLNPRASPRV